MKDGPLLHYTIENHSHTVKQFHSNSACGLTPKSFLLKTVPDLHQRWTSIYNPELKLYRITQLCVTEEHRVH